MNRDRRSQVRKQVLRYLADLLSSHPDSDNGLYQNPEGEQMTDEECAYAKRIAEDEGRRMRTRSEGFCIEVYDRAKSLTADSITDADIVALGEDPRSSLKTSAWCIEAMRLTRGSKKAEAAKMKARARVAEILNERRAKEKP